MLKVDSLQILHSEFTKVDSLHFEKIEGFVRKTVYKFFIQSLQMLTVFTLKKAVKWNVEGWQFTNCSFRVYKLNVDSMTKKN